MPEEGFVSVASGYGIQVGVVDFGGTSIQRVFTAPYAEPLGYATEDDLSSSTALPTVPGEAVRAIVQVEGGDVRYRPDGDPTATDGMLLPANTVTELAFGQAILLTTRLILAAGSPKITVIYL